MSYEPTTWKDGDLVTSAKLNKIEQGIANGGNILFCNGNFMTGQLDATWQEIFDAPICLINLVQNEEDYKMHSIEYVTRVGYMASLDPGAQYFLTTNEASYIADSADSYPAYDSNSGK